MEDVVTLLRDYIIINTKESVNMKMKKRKRDEGKD